LKEAVKVMIEESPESRDLRAHEIDRELQAPGGGFRGL
jgi:hypothetical protein